MKIGNAMLFLQIALNQRSLAIKYNIECLHYCIDESCAIYEDQKYNDWYKRLLAYRLLICISFKRALFALPLSIDFFAIDNPSLRLVALPHTTNAAALFNNTISL